MGSKSSKPVSISSRRSSTKSVSQNSNDSDTELSDPREEDVTGVNFLKQKFNFKTTITCADLSDDSSMLVVGREDGILEIFSTFSRESISLAVLRGHKDSVTCCQFSENNIFSGSSDSTIIKWSIVTMSPIYVYRGHTSKINKLMVVDHLLFSSGYDRTAKVWYAEPPDSFFDSELDSNANVKRKSVSISKSGHSSSRHSSVQTEEYFIGPPRVDPLLLRTLTGHSKSVYPLEFIPAGDNWNLRERQLYDRDLLITGSADCTARIWSITLGECLKELIGHSAPIFSIRVAHELNNTIFTAGGDGVIHSYCPITGDLLQRLIGHEGPILSMISTKNMLFTGSTDRTTRSWVIEFGEETRTFRGNCSPINCLSYLESLLFTGCEDGITRVFDSKSGCLLRSYRDTQNCLGPIVSLHNVPGKVFALSADGFLNIWDSKGVKVQAAFGDTHSDASGDEESEIDSADFVEAMNVMDKFLQKR